MVNKIMRGAVPSLFGAVFLLVSLPCLSISASLARESISLLQTGERVEARVIEMTQRRGSKSGWVYSPVFRFQDKAGVSHVIRSTSASNPPAYDVGDRVTALHPPGKPNEAVIQSFLELWMGPLISGIIGLSFFGVGLGSIISIIRKQRLKKWLLQHGRRIPTEIAGIDINRHIRINRIHPVQIISTWNDPQTGTDYTFKSDDFWKSPAAQLEGKTTIDVLIRVDNPKKYWMDTSFLT